MLALVSLTMGLSNGCKKNSSDTPATSTGIAASFTEEFQDVGNLLSKGWVMKDNSTADNADNYAAWVQGYQGADKVGTWSGFSAFSYTSSLDEFAYSAVSSPAQKYSISSWLISPVLAVKNGDKISFYTRADSAGNFTERMQVLMNKSTLADVGSTINSVGRFNTVLLEINAAQTVNGYPGTWAKYDYTFSGISGKIDTRIAFRHYVIGTSNAKGIGIDLFKFQVN